MSTNEKIKGISSKTKKNGETVYRVDTRVNGKKVQTKWTSDLNKVQKELGKYSQLRSPIFHKNQYTKNDKDIKLAELLEMFYAHQNQTLSKNYAINCRYLLDSFFKTYLTYSLSEISKIDFTGIFYKYLRNTAKIMIAVISSFVKFAKAHEYPLDINVEKLRLQTKNLAPSEQKIHFLNAKEVHKLFTYLEEEGGNLLEFKKAATIAIYGGLRLGEVLALRYNCLDLDNETIVVKSTLNFDGTYKNGTKNGKIRLVKMAPHVKKICEEFLSKSPNSKDLVFNHNHGWVSGIITKLKSKKILNPKYSFHTFRHTFASLFFSQFGTTHDCLVQLQELMGHSDLAMTLKYVHAFQNAQGNILADLSFSTASRIAESRNKADKEQHLKAIIDLQENQDLGVIQVKAPYFEGVEGAFKPLEGVWDTALKTWIFPIAYKTQVEQILKQQFGYTPKQSVKEQIETLLAQVAQLQKYA